MIIAYILYKYIDFSIASMYNTTADEYNTEPHVYSHRYMKIWSMLLCFLQHNTKQILLFDNSIAILARPGHFVPVGFSLMLTSLY